MPEEQRARVAGHTSLGNHGAPAKPARPVEAAAVNAVYEKLSDLLNALREAQSKIHHQQLHDVIDHVIDRFLAIEEELRTAIVEHTGRPVQDPY